MADGRAGTGRASGWPGYPRLLAAARADAGAARFVLRRAREALRLPDKKYLKEELVGLIGQVLHHCPAPESPRQPVELDGKVVYVPVGPRVCPQGAPTSPGLCNAVLLRLDHRLTGLARKHGYTYTRYADDLTFSGDDPEKIKHLITVASWIVREEGFALNRKKTRVLRRSRRQLVTGVVVNQSAGLSRRDRRRLRAAIHQLAQSPQSADAGNVRRLVGKLAYLKMLNPNQAAPLIAALNRVQGPGLRE